ncbi:MAG: universal stress protein, partial [Rhodothermia bacterium]
MLKRLLVPLDPSPFSQTAVSYACELASYHGAEVTGLVIIDLPGIRDSVAPFSPGSAHYAEKAELRLGAEAHEALRGIQSSFASKCEAVGVAHRSIERQGDPVEIIAHESAYYDLLVIGLRTHFNFQTSSAPGKTLSELMGHLATPILAVPETYSPFGSKLDAVLAFDGSPAAIRSMRQFA